MGEWRKRAVRDVAFLAGTTKTAAPNGVVLWTGPSAFNGKRIALIAIGMRTATTNPKTGDLVQTYILKLDENPHRAARAGTRRSAGTARFGRPRTSSAT